MFSLPLRMARGADAIEAERNTGRRAARAVAIGSAEAFWLALIAALFVSWAMCPSPNQSRFDRLFPGLRVHRKGRRHL